MSKMSQQSTCDDCNNRMVKFEYECLYNLTPEPNNILQGINQLLMGQLHEPTIEEMLNSNNLKKNEFKRENEAAMEKKMNLSCVNKQPTETKNALPTFPRLFPGNY